MVRIARLDKGLMSLFNYIETPNTNLVYSTFHYTAATNLIVFLDLLHLSCSFHRSYYHADMRTHFLL